MATPQQKTRLKVQVVCLSGGVAFMKDMLVPAGQMAGWCVNASGLYGLHPHLRETSFLGIWGHKVAPDVCVAEGDRIEVLLPVSPTAQARARAMRKG